MKKEPINTYCPWSGDPVSNDATIQYRGQTVAFCNPDFRDKFATAINMFDVAIARRSEPVLEPVDIAKYEPRVVRFDQILAVGDVRLKLYHMTETAEKPIDELVANKATEFVRDNLPEKIRNSGGDHGLGYILLHRGVTDHWLLMHWWGGGDICLSSLGRLKGGESEFQSQDETHLHACVWEHVVIDHERDAWVRTMMTESPKPGAYLNDRLSDGSY